jgi:RecB family exonuclease
VQRVVKSDSASAARLLESFSAAVASQPGASPASLLAAARAGGGAAAAHVATLSVATEAGRRAQFEDVCLAIIDAVLRAGRTPQGA